jgi:hypothetical protein
MASQTTEKSVSAVSSAASGAAVGTAVAPGIGTAIGAALGAILSGIVGNNSGSNVQQQISSDTSFNVSKFRSTVNQYAKQQYPQYSSEINQYFEKVQVANLQQNPYYYDIGTPEPRYPKGNNDILAEIDNFINQGAEMAETSIPDPNSSGQDLTDLVRSLNQTALSSYYDIQAIKTQGRPTGTVANAETITNRNNMIFIVMIIGLVILLIFLRKKR